MDEYLRFRTSYQDISGNLTVAAAGDDATLVTIKNAFYTIWIQRVIVYIFTDAAQSWSFEDSNSPAKVIAVVTTSPGAASRWCYDYGPLGLPLTAGKNFLLNVSAAGLAGNITWNGYEKLTGTTALSNT